MKKTKKEIVEYVLSTYTIKCPAGMPLSMLIDRINKMIITAEDIAFILKSYDDNFTNAKYKHKIYLTTINRLRNGKIKQEELQSYIDCCKNAMIENVKKYNDENFPIAGRYVEQILNDEGNAIVFMTDGQIYHDNNYSFEDYTRIYRALYEPFNFNNVRIYKK